MSQDRHSYDPGVQPERTRLAWQRTSLALLGCALVAARLLATHAPVPAILVGVLAIGLSLAMGLLSRRRHLRFRDGRLPVLVTALLLLAGLTSLGLALTL